MGGRVGGVVAAIILFAGSLFAGSVAAQPAKLQYTVNVYDAVVTYPAAIWYDGGDPIAMSEHYRRQDGPEFVLEQIPKGQSFETWTSLYAVRGYDLGVRPDLSLDQFLGANLMTPYERSCGSENLAVQVLERLADRVTLVFICQNSPAGPTALGYGDGIGELAVYKAFKVRSTFVEVFQKWRGPAFVADDAVSWPASSQSVNGTIRLFRQVEAVAVR